MLWKDALATLSEAVDGRVSPVFKPHHVAVALIMIGREEPLGRYELCARLSIGEGSARTLLKRLTEAEIITAEGRQGQILTEKGKDIFRKIRQDIPLGLSLNLGGLVVFQNAFANLAKNRAGIVTDGIRQRDEAIIQGGYGKSGATTLVNKKGQLIMPPGDYNILLDYQDEALLLMDSLRSEDGDAIIIGSADDPNLAREVAMAATLTLFEKD